MTNPPRGEFPRNSRTGSDPRARAEFDNRLAEFLTAVIADTPKKPGIKYDDLVFGLIDAVVRASKTVPNGMGIAILQTITIELIERVNAELQRSAPEAAHTDAGALAPPVENQPLLRNESTVDPVDTPAITTWEGTTFQNEESPLHRLGYTVTEGRLSAERRRSVLVDAFQIEHLPGITDEIDKKRWGKPSSAQRLYAVSTFIVWLVSFQGSEKPAAREKWIEDLAWLKTKFYRSEMRFDWPSVRGKHLPNADFMKALTPSQQLAAVVGAAPLPRTEVVSKLWEYIKQNKLQDAVNKRMVNADATLMPIFGKRQVSMFEMAGLIGKHLL